MIKYFFYGVLFIFVFSCSSKDKAPSGVIQPKEMKSILWDVMRAQNLATTLQRQDSSVNAIAETKTLTQKIFNIHKITAADFDKSYDWYLKHPEALKLIFDSLYIQKQRENSLQLKEKDTHDSLHKKSLRSLNKKIILP